MTQPESLDPLPLTMAFIPTASDTLIRWESDVIGTRRSRLVDRYSHADWSVILRALDHLQFPGGAFSTDELARLIIHGMADADQTIMNDLHRRVGFHLYQALTADPVGAQALDTVRNAATAMGRPIAWRLLFPPDAVSLAALPWELLWDHGPTPVILSRGQLAGFTRHLDLNEALPPGRRLDRKILRILALTPRADVHETAAMMRINAQRALWKSLREAGHAEVIECSPVTRRDLVDALQANPLPDVVHFTGHGQYREGVGSLIIDRADGRWDRLTADQLAAISGGIQMVVLNACQGAALDQASELQTAIAPALSAAGVPIVLGMQYTIRAASAHRAAEVLYRAVGQGRSIQEAVSMVRQALYVEEPEQSAWYVPALYIRSRETVPIYL